MILLAFLGIQVVRGTCFSDRQNFCKDISEEIAWLPRDQELFISCENHKQEDSFYEEGDEKEIEIEFESQNKTHGIFKFSKESLGASKHPTVNIKDGQDCLMGHANLRNGANIIFKDIDLDEKLSSTYEITEKLLKVTLRLNRDLGAAEMEEYYQTLVYWKDHYAFSLEAGEVKEYYITKRYKENYCRIREETDGCKGKIIQDLRVIKYEIENVNKLMYQIIIPMDIIPISRSSNYNSMEFKRTFGKLTSHILCGTIIFHWSTRIIILITLGLIAFLCGMAFAYIKFRQYIETVKDKAILGEKTKLTSNNRPAEAYGLILGCMEENDKKVFKKIYIDPKKITSDGRELGKGAFGTTKAGKLLDDNDTVIYEIAIKTMRNSAANGFCGPGYQSNYPGSTSGQYFDGKHAQEIFDEALQMHKFEHNHVMKLIGVSLNVKAEPEMILPLMDLGDLRSYIKKDEVEIQIKDCLKFAHQSAEGMYYLTQHGVIHRDLAARNCLLETMDGGRINLRIADFGLSKTFQNLYQEEYVSESQGKLPLKWLALEVLEHRLFSEKSDVWAFGILVWEIFTRGMMPYGSLSDWAGLKLHLLNGDRLDMPESCSPEVYEIMIACWHDEAQQRPTFDELVSQFSKLVKGHRESETKRGRVGSLPKRANISFKRNHFSRTKATYKSNRNKPKSRPVPVPRKPLPAVPQRDASLTPLLRTAEEIV